MGPRSNLQFTNQETIYLSHALINYIDTEKIEKDEDALNHPTEEWPRKFYHSKGVYQVLFVSADFNTRQIFKDNLQQHY